MADLCEVGGIPAIHKVLIAAGLLDGTLPTVTRKTLAENVASAPSLDSGQSVIRALSNPIKESGHLQVLRDNIAPKGAVAKVTGKEGLKSSGKARHFDKEWMPNQALDAGEIPHDTDLGLVVRYEGPKGGPGMPEQLRASAAIMGAGLNRVALITDGRYTGASHGFIVGHIAPEAAIWGPIALVQDDDEITIDATTNTIQVNLSNEELKSRKSSGNRLEAGLSEVLWPSIHPWSAMLVWGPSPIYFDLYFK
ncbi:mitochondrial dihydroxy acid dehydratase [Aspergillus flavus AF70]|nr:mitochondrial dihydroxy acid dehydratase [Aspergillus flavus AF70]